MIISLRGDVDWYQISAISNWLFLEGFFKMQVYANKPQAKDLLTYYIGIYKRLVIIVTKTFPPRALQFKVNCEW